MPRSITILYGTETGNSQDCSEYLARKCLRLHFDVQVASMDDYDVSDLPMERLVIFICSTTGQGDLPKNTHKLWKVLLRRKLPPSLLSSVQFTTFGLGDSSYPRFNWAIRKLHKRLLQLGCREFAERGEGDEQHPEGIEPVFEAWCELVLDKLNQLYPLDPGVEPIPEKQLLPPRYQIYIHKDKFKRATNVSDISTSRPRINVGTVMFNRRITHKEHFQDVRQLKFFSDESSTYKPGDAVALYPKNDNSDVDTIIKYLNFEDIADCCVTVNEEYAKAVPGGLVSPLTLRSLFTYHLDLMSIPRRTFFSKIYHFSFDNEREKERLYEFSTLEGLQDLFDYANRPRRSVLETITEFDSLKIPVEYILDIFPILRPRLYSIASPTPFLTENISKNSEIELAIAIVKYKTIIRKIRRGVCSRWVENLEENEKIPFSIHHTPFTNDYSCPCLMIAPGTGVAPMRSLILTRQLNGSEKTNIPDVLFFGCRYKDKDYYFKEDWKALIESGKLEVYTAFSREKEGYVQDVLYANSSKIAQLITHNNATVYVCGSSGAMPRQVRITIVTILEQIQNWTQQQAEKYVENMERQGKYLQETWS